MAKDRNGNDFDWWRMAKARPHDIGVGDLALHHDVVHEGYYRQQDRATGNWVPLGFYHVNGVLCGFKNGNPISSERMFVEFYAAAEQPIEYQAYERALKGGGWDDEPPPRMGHNRAPSENETEFERLERELREEEESAKEFLRKPVETQAQADMCSIWKKRLTKLRNAANAAFDVEKRPHLEAGRAVDEKYRILRTRPDELAKMLGEHQKPFLKKKEREEEERQRKARDEAERIKREAAERERLAREAEEDAARQAQEEAERAAAEMDTVGQDPEAEERARVAAENAAAAQRDADRLKTEREEQAKRDADAVAEAEREAQARRVQSGRTGAKSSIRKTKVAHITDYVALATALIGMKDKAVIDVLDQRANAAASKGFPLNGVEIVEKETVV